MLYTRLPWEQRGHVRLLKNRLSLRKPTAAAAARGRRRRLLSAGPDSVSGPVRPTGPGPTPGSGWRRCPGGQPVPRCGPGPRTVGPAAGAEPRPDRPRRGPPPVRVAGDSSRNRTLAALSHRLPQWPGLHRGRATGSAGLTEPGRRGVTSPRARNWASDSEPESLISERLRAHWQAAAGAGGPPAVAAGRAAAAAAAVTHHHQQTHILIIPNYS